MILCTIENSLMSYRKLVSEMIDTESTVNRWIRRDAKVKTKRRFTSDNRGSIRNAMERIIKNAKEAKW